MKIYEKGSISRTSAFVTWPESCTSVMGNLMMNTNTQQIIMIYTCIYYKG